MLRVRRRLYPFIVNGKTGAIDHSAHVCFIVFFVLAAFLAKGVKSRKNQRELGQCRYYCLGRLKSCVMIMGWLDGCGESRLKHGVFFRHKKATGTNRSDMGRKQTESFTAKYWDGLYKCSLYQSIVFL